MPVSSGIAQARRCAGKRIVTSGFKPTMESFARGNLLRRVNHQPATSTTGHCGAAISSRRQPWTVQSFYQFTLIGIELKIVSSTLKHVLSTSILIPKLNRCKRHRCFN
jgi:hypothetical protein